MTLHLNPSRRGLSDYRLHFARSLVQSLGLDEAVAACRRPELRSMLPLVRDVGLDVCGR